MTPAEPDAEAIEIANGCRKEGRRIYNREHAKWSLVECENIAIAAAITAARAQGAGQIVALFERRAAATNNPREYETLTGVLSEIRGMALREIG